MAYWCTVLEDWQSMQQQFMTKLPVDLPDLGFKSYKASPWEPLHLNTFISWGQSAVKQSMDLQSNWVKNWLWQIKDESTTDTINKAEMIKSIHESMENWSESQRDLWAYWFKMVEKTSESAAESTQLTANLSQWQSTVAEMLNTQIEKLEQWTQAINMEELSTEELYVVSDKLQQTINGCLDMQWQLWTQWFNFLDIEATQQEAPLVEPSEKALNQKRKDNLQQISGIGPAIAKKLYTHGIYSINQIAQLTEQQIDSLEASIIKVPGRIRRDDWVAQAIAIIKEG